MSRGIAALRRLAWRPGPAVWLGIAIALYFAVALALSWLRAIELQTTTWDLGLYQQAIWSTAHGHPFYETADVETGGFGSLLDVHTAFVLYALVPLYDLLPYETTLLAVQAAVVALAAVPLFLLARDLTGSPRMGLAAGVMYLAWAPTLTSNLYDFHPEAFLPIELFALVLLWNRQRFVAGFAVAAVAFLTLEVAPVLVFFVGLFALVGAAGAWSVPAGRTVRWLPRTVAALRSALATPVVRASLGLMLASGIVYAALFLLRVEVFPAAFGTYATPVADSGYVIGVTPNGLGLQLTNLTVGLGAKLSYWLILVALLAFVPLLAPRALILSLPWFVFTLFSSNLNYVTLGYQYGFIAGSSLLVAFAFALVPLRRWLDRRPFAAGRSGSPARRPAWSGSGSPARVAILAVAFAGLLAINVAVTPVNPALQQIGPGSAYRVAYDPPPGTSAVVTLAGLVPQGATVVASDDLFPLLADDPNAYSFSWTLDSALYLPFGPTDPPDFVFVAENRMGAVVPWIAAELYDPLIFGVRGVAWSSPAGTVLLFERGFRGPADALGPEPTPGGEFFGPALVDATAGAVEHATDSEFPSVVVSVPGSVGTMWYGPDVNLPAGNYTVTVSLRASPIPAVPEPTASTAIVWIGASAFAQPSLDGRDYTFGALNVSGFDTLAFRLSLTGPTVGLDIQGQLLNDSSQLTLNYVGILPE